MSSIVFAGDPDYSPEIEKGIEIICQYPFKLTPLSNAILSKSQQYEIIMNKARKSWWNIQKYKMGE